MVRSVDGAHFASCAAAVDVVDQPLPGQAALVSYSQRAVAEKALYYHHLP